MVVHDFQFLRNNAIMHFKLTAINTRKIISSSICFKATDLAYKNAGFFINEVIFIKPHADPTERE
ncbi:hypothetical protein T07_9945 [Trichinella nelsoni]|uniref:Uncharacterized protein n=1 Tax=Trichinella nelsoni TaxID=6336 RepID=A0A0V0SG97_9BILA|nr:hypothetical protein T07_9945 [Trichinella nelsoni]